jgi:hypothetical protein
MIHFASCAVRQPNEISTSAKLPGVAALTAAICATCGLMTAHRPAPKTTTAIYLQARRFGSVRHEFKNSLNLFARNAKFFHQPVNVHILKIFEHSCTGRAGAPEYPCAAALAGDTLHGGTL